MTTQRVVQSTHTSQSGINSAENLPQKDKLGFCERLDHLKAWIDDFVLFSTHLGRILHLG